MRSDGRSTTGTWGFTGGTGKLLHTQAVPGVIADGSQLQRIGFATLDRSGQRALQEFHRNGGGLETSSEVAEARVIRRSFRQLVLCFDFARVPIAQTVTSDSLQ